LRAPFLGLVLDRIDVRAQVGLGTAQVRLAPERAVLEYDPEYLGGLTPRERIAVLEHELWHVVNGHRDRREGRDPLRWNFACDLAINQFIEGLPRGALRAPPHLRGKSAEEIYDEIGGAETSFTASPCLGVPMQDSPGDGGRARSRGWLAAALRARRAPGLSASEGWFEAFFAAYQGETVIDGSHTAHAELAPAGTLRIDWAGIVGRHARRGARRRTLTRPNRRGLSVWGCVPERRPSVVAIVDTSGSISARLGAMFLAELHRLRAVCADLVVVLADAAVRVVTPFERLGGHAFEGRGGTSFGPAIAHVNAHLGRRDLVVYLTDGGGVVPAERPRMPFVWVVAGHREFAGHPMIRISTH
jgi:predicted metal-dependent peptidase